MYFSPIVIVPVTTLAFWIIHKLGAYMHINEHHDIVLRVSSSLVGLLLASSSFLQAGRNNETLDELKHRSIWVISEVSSFYGLLSFFLSTVISYYNMVSPKLGFFWYASEQIIFISGLVYLFVEIMGLRNALKYL
jgi:hypothetical protein